MLFQLTSELLLGLGVASHNVTDPGISSTIGMSSTTVLPKGSSIASFILEKYTGVSIMSTFYAEKQINLFSKNCFILTTMLNYNNAVLDYVLMY